MTDAAKRENSGHNMFARTHKCFMDAKHCLQSCNHGDFSDKENNWQWQTGHRCKEKLANMWGQRLTTANTRSLAAGVPVHA